MSELMSLAVYVCDKLSGIVQHLPETPAHWFARLAPRSFDTLLWRVSGVS